MPHPTDVRTPTLLERLRRMLGLQRTPILTPALVEFRALMEERTRRMSHTGFLRSFGTANARRYAQAYGWWIVNGHDKVTAEDYYWRALLRMDKLDDAAGATRDLSAASKLEPHNVDVWVGLGNLAMARGDLDRAKECLLWAARQCDPGNFFPWFNLGRAHMCLGEWQLAASAFDRAVAISGNAFDAEKLRDQCRRHAGL